MLVSGGPAPGTTGVIGAATIRRQSRRVEVLGIRDGFEWIMHGNVEHVVPLHHRGRQPHPLPRRLVHRHLAANPTKDPQQNTVIRCCA